MSKWIEFKFTGDTGKTEKWAIYTKTEPPVFLGEIKWYGPWRQYSFFPAPNTVFEKTCLGDIEMKIQRLQQDHKEKKHQAIPV